VSRFVRTSQVRLERQIAAKRSHIDSKRKWCSFVPNQTFSHLAMASDSRLILRSATNESSADFIRSGMAQPPVSYKAGNFRLLVDQSQRNLALSHTQATLCWRALHPELISWLFPPILDTLSEWKVILWTRKSESCSNQGVAQYPPMKFSAVQKLATIFWVVHFYRLLRLSCWNLSPNAHRHW